jgi:peptide/nickel transport system ATP-binding protein
LTYLLITHDLATAKFVCDRIAIMYLGRIVETGAAEAIYRDPKHPYTKALIAAIPVPEPGRTRQVTLPRGEVPDAITPPAGCRFHPRCPVALPSCGWEGRDFVDLLEQAGLQEGWHASELIATRKVREGPEDAIRWVRERLAQAPAPLAAAVAEVATVDDQIVVRFRPPDALVAREVEGRTVECLLY